METNKEKTEKDNKGDKKFNAGCLIFFLVVMAILVFTKSIFITTEGCTLPIDVVLFDHCLFGSFGASIGATIAGIIIFGVLGFILRAIFRLFK